LIENQLDWGPSQSWRTRDFEKLNLLILEKTKVSLSASTLRRVWGKVDYSNQPSGTTLDTLAQFAGFENWRFFDREAQSREKQPPKLRWAVIALVLSGLAVLIASLIRTELQKPAPIPYEFRSHPTTHDLPNSIVFHYNAEAAGTDSVYLQQDWDDSKRAALNKAHHEVSSIYYRPGYYEAKLVVGKNIVKQDPLLIPTDGWLGLVAQKPVPVYLSRDEFTDNTRLHVSGTTLEKYKVAIGSQPPVVEFYNVGNFKPVPLADFTFSADVKNEYNVGASKCQQVSIILITNGVPVSIPLSAPGCIAGITLTDGLHDIPGTADDLSGFGADLTAWVKVLVKGDGQAISYLVNGKVAYRSKLSRKDLKILGIGLVFQGTGSARNIDLISKEQYVFQSFIAAK
jgi:hypothetical protein